MRIAIIGFGKMGRQIESVAREQGDVVVRVFDIEPEVTAESLADVDICIEFSTPDAVLSNIRVAVQARKDIVVGTTGWYEHLPEIRKTVTDSGLLYSPNFSLGMNMFLRLVRRAAELINNARGYDPYVYELHHRKKADSPSGTALRIGQILVEEIERKQSILSQPPDGPISDEMLHVCSIRAGAAAGTHVVGFDSDADLIELHHVAKNRKGFALGAIAAARWLRGRKGVYTMDDVEL